MQSHFLAFHFEFQTAFNVNDKLPKVKKKGIFLSQWIGKKGRFSVAFRQAAQSVCGCQRKSFSYSVKTDSVFTERILACCGMYISFFTIFWNFSQAKSSFTRIYIARACILVHLRYNKVNVILSQQRCMGSRYEDKEGS